MPTYNTCTFLTIKTFINKPAMQWSIWREMAQKRKKLMAINF